VERLIFLLDDDFTTFLFLFLFCNIRFPPKLGKRFFLFVQVYRALRGEEREERRERRGEERRGRRDERRGGRRDAVI
jgi:hypothetical protein